MKTFIFIITIFFLGCKDGDNKVAIFDAEVKEVQNGTWYKPIQKTSWQWQLQGDINTSYDVTLYDIDLFDTDKSLIDELHTKDIKVICYFSAGTFEDWRDDKNSFPSNILGDRLDEWNDERWLNIADERLAPIMKARLDLAVSKGCDGVEPDNMDGYTNQTGFNLQAIDQLAYNKFLANEARKRGLSVGLKNDLDQLTELEPYFDFLVNEQCHIYNECNKTLPFIERDKPVFNAEYQQKYIDNNNSERDILCQESKSLGIETLVLPLYLDDSFRFSCENI